MKRGIEGHHWSKLRRLGSKKDEQGPLSRFQVGGFDPRTIATSSATAMSSSIMTATTSAAAAMSATITTATGRVSNVSDFISSFDEAARRRLNSMNEKLRGLEMQMQTFENEMHKANDSSAWS